MKKLIKDFILNQHGGITALGLFMIMAIFAVGGLAIDVTNVIRERTHLQIAADSAAHAALVARQSQGEAAAKMIALDVAEVVMPSAIFGDTLKASDIFFGTYDSATGGFSVGSGVTDAVLVNTQRLASRGNSVGTFFLRFVGMNNWDVREQSVFETYKPTCFREGFVAQGVVDVQSGNNYTDGFCIHSNTHIDVQNGNDYENGVIVSMPNEGDLVMPTAGAASNTGLMDSLRSGSYKLRIVNRINDIIAGVQDPTSQYYRDYITSATPIYINPNQKLDANWVEGRIHIADCANSHKQLLSNSGVTMRKGILITSCKLLFPNSITFEDAVIASTNTLADSISMASTFTLGLDDGCTAGGGTQVVTLGGISFAADVSFYGSQVIAAGDIDFTSNALGVEGVSLVAGGDISGTTNSDIGFCGGKGMENSFEAWYFRMAA